ncbi:hypothetical protein [Kribbella sp. CA-293567]|uniref:ApeA N-terminal domain 1-containing protein n=1 Tax=Kribbella sp. CA-293567 TaxID=3002436 RepID=UPI0022DD2945|nr:hypothetical protein [Kribbella sp. CA-293567]WBQ06822.1 hypothetical protein OX958_08505 [Kribbella sp. CA-293567]
MTIESFEVNGNWWLPGKSEDPVAGRLTFDPESGIELALVGTLTSHKKTVLEDGSTVTELSESTLGGDHDFVHGFNGKESYTLIDCFTAKSSTTFPSMYGEEVIRANSMVKGAHFAGEGPMDAEGFTIRTKYLAHWMDTPGFEADPDGKPQDEMSKTLRIVQRPAESFILANDMKAKLAHVIGWEGDGITSRTLQQDYNFGARGDTLVELQDLLDIASDFQDLVSIGTGRTAEYSRVWLSRSDVHEKSMADTDLGEKSLEFFARWNVRDDVDSKPLWSHAMYFSYKDIGGIKGVEAWLNTAAKYRSLLSRVMAMRFSKSSFVSDRLMNRAAALEALDKALTGYAGSAFKTRIGRCGQLAGPEFVALIGGDVTKWAKAIEFERHDIAHHLGRHIRPLSPELHFLAESLYWAFILCILREMSVDQAVYVRIFQNQNMAFLGPKIQSAVDAIVSLADAEAAATTG